MKTEKIIAQISADRETFLNEHQFSNAYQKRRTLYHSASTMTRILRMCLREKRRIQQECRLR